MSIEAEITVLKRLGFFACLPEKQLRTLVFGAERLRLQEGRALYSEGEVADCAYIVLGGRIDLFRSVRAEAGGGRQRAFRRAVYAVKSGAMLGAMALISHKRRETGAYVGRRGDVLRVNRPVFRRLLSQHSDMRRNLARYILTDFQQMTARLEERAAR